MFARCWIAYRKQLEAIGKDYDDCPIRCTRNKKKQYSIKRNDFCEKCPRRQKKTEFGRTVEREWDKWLGEKVAKKLKFSNFERDLRNILSIKGMPPEMLSPKSAVLIDIYEEEKNRLEKSDRVSNL